MADDAEVRRYQLVRDYTVLVVGVGLILYGLVQGAPAIFTFGGAMLGGVPVVRSAA